MADFDDVVRGVELGKKIRAMLGPEALDGAADKLTEIKSIKPESVGGLMNLGQLALLNYEVHREKFDELKRSAAEQLGPENNQLLTEMIGQFVGELSEQIDEDVERMARRLVELGYPDVHVDPDNWRIIARMAGCNPDGFMEDIFEHAVAAAMAKHAEQTDKPEAVPQSAVRAVAVRLVSDLVGDVVSRAEELKRLRDEWIKHKLSGGNKKTFGTKRYNRKIYLEKTLG